jgi:hypothetical protein
MQSRWLFLEKNEVEPSGQQQVAVAESIALSRILASLVKNAPAEAVPVDAETVGGSIEERFSR